MPWAKIDDQLAFHPKILAAGNEAVGAWVRMLAWSCAFGTDGEIPHSVALQIAGNDAILSLLNRCRIVDHIDDETEQIHDYLQWNLSAKQEKQKAEKRHNAGRVGGLASAQARAQRIVERIVNEKASKGDGDGDGDLLRESSSNKSCSGKSAESGEVVDPQAQSKEKASTESGDSARVFEHYRSLHALAKMGKKAQVKLRERFREKWTGDELIEAIDGAHKTPWNNGEETGKKWLDLDLILRDADQVRRFIENNRDPPELRGPRVTSINAHTAGIMGILAMAKKEEEKNARRREGQVSENICGNGELLSEPANTAQSRGGVLAAPEILLVRRSADGHGSGHG